MVIAVIAIVIVLVAALQISPLIERKAKLEKEVASIDSLMAEKKTQLDSLDAEISQLTPLAKKGLGYKEEKVEHAIPISKASLQASQALSQLSKEWEQRQPEPQATRAPANSGNNWQRNRRPARTDNRPVITVYTKNLEKEINIKTVCGDLEDKGFRIDYKNSQLQSVETNAVWFGRNISIDEVKIVALQLMSAGVQIKAIRPFKNRNSKINIIEVGGDAALNNQAPMTVQEVRNANSFGR